MAKCIDLTGSAVKGLIKIGGLDQYGKVCRLNGICSERVNTLTWYAVCENIRGFCSYYCPLGMTLSGDGAAPVEPTAYSD